jgi:iron(III) transport system ATP-binding protein
VTHDDNDNGNGFRPPCVGLRLRGLQKSFGSLPAVDGVDLELRTGGICALLGPSGCGKTTTLRLIAGLERPDAGEIVVGGRVMSGGGRFVAAEERRIGMVFQDYALFPHMDVAGNVGYGLGRKPDRTRVCEALELVGLADAGKRPVHELSGGQQQRVALARALAPTPDLVLLDEPFSNLDAGLRDRLRQEVRAILRDAGVTALFVTHDQEEAMSIAETVAVMHDGRVEQAGTPEEVYLRPATRWMATFLGDIEVLPGDARGGRASCELGNLPVGLDVAGACDVLVRPESVAIGVSGPAGAAPAEVVSRRFFGHDQLVGLRLRSGHELSSRRLGYPAWHPGDHVQVWIEGPAEVLPRSNGRERAPSQQEHVPLGHGNDAA